jgi:hypothetical protein
LQPWREYSGHTQRARLNLHGGLKKTTKIKSMALSTLFAKHSVTSLNSAFRAQKRIPQSRFKYTLVLTRHGQ